MGALQSRLAELRQRRGIRQQDLAAAAGVSRQALSAVEAGRSGPSVELALRLAAALGCRVDELFWIDDAAPIAAELAGAGARRGEHVAVVSVDGTRVAHPLGRDAASGRIAADGIVVDGGRSRRRRVQLLRGADEIEGALLCVGCAPALGILAARAAERRGPRVLWLERSSEQALSLLARGHAHIAGAHLLDPSSGDYNVPRVRALMPGRALRVIELARWEAGLVVPAGNPRRLRRVADLARRGITLARRDAGSGAEALLRRLLDEAGVPRAAADAITAGGPIVHGHLDAARAVALGAADAAIAIGSAALAFGLDFVPLAEERFDLVLGQAAAADPRVVRFLDTLSGRAFRRELESLGGYRAGDAGRVVAELA
jgi:putative molybdopterin biosynthesis protein